MEGREREVGRERSGLVWANGSANICQLLTIAATFVGCQSLMRSQLNFRQGLSSESDSGSGLGAGLGWETGIKMAPNE